MPSDVTQTDDLFVNLAEQLKLPFLQIAQAAELLDNPQDPAAVEQSRHAITLATQASLRLIDSYLLGVRLQREQRLDLEPVPMSSVLYDTAASLRDFARAHNCKLELNISGRFAPVMAHRAAMLAALTSLGYSFIEALSAQSEEASLISLNVQKNRMGLSVGVYGGQQGISSTLLKRARILKGKTYQPMAGFDSGMSAGIFIADALFNRMDASMRVARSSGRQGLAATFLPSRQLSLV